MRYKRIQYFCIEVLKPIIKHLQKTKNVKRMPWRDLETILKILYPETKYEKRAKGYYKNVFIIHNENNWFALKIGRSAQHIKKDMKTYERLPRSRNRYYAKIYWAKDLFMLQKWGEEVEVPNSELKRLKNWGAKVGLKDIRPANIMKVDNRFKIVDAERT